VVPFIVATCFGPKGSSSNRTLKKERYKIALKCQRQGSILTLKKCDMIFINCNWVSKRWQWWVDLYRNRKETVIYKRRNSAKNKTQTENTQNRKQTKQTREHRHQNE
jgi:hypothetical protein